MKKNLILSIAILLGINLGANAQANYNRNNNDDNYYVQRRTNYKNENTIYPSVLLCYYPIASIAGQLKFGVEKKLSENKSLKTNIRFGYGDKSNFYQYDRIYYSQYYSYYGGSNQISSGNSTTYIKNYLMAMLEAQYRYYFADKAPCGAYTGIYGFYKLANFSYDTNELNGSDIVAVTKTKLLNGGSIGIIVGYQNVFPDKISLDFYFGTGANFTSADGDKLKGLSSSGIADRFYNGIGFLMGANIGLAVKK